MTRTCTIKILGRTCTRYIITQQSTTAICGLFLSAFSCFSRCAGPTCLQIYSPVTVGDRAYADRILATQPLHATPVHLHRNDPGALTVLFCTPTTLCVFSECWSSAARTARSKHSDAQVCQRPNPRQNDRSNNGCFHVSVLLVGMQLVLVPVLHVKADVLHGVVSFLSSVHIHRRVRKHVFRHQTRARLRSVARLACHAADHTLVKASR